MKKREHMHRKGSAAMQTRHIQRRNRQNGFTVAEVVLALTVFLIMTLVFAAVFPLAVRGAQFSNNYAQAGQLAQHKIDQLRAAGFTKIDYTDLNALSIVDTMSSPPASLPASFPFTSSDNLTSNGTTQGYFPPGSTGTIYICDYNSGATFADGTVLPGNSAVPAGQVDYVTIKIKWTGGGVSSGSYSVSAMIIKMLHR